MKIIGVSRGHDLVMGVPLQLHASATDQRLCERARMHADCVCVRESKCVCVCVCVAVIMSPYEKNPFFWRQLWRVVERSDLVVQVLDARTPLVRHVPFAPAPLTCMHTRANRDSELPKGTRSRAATRRLSGARACGHAV